MPDIPHVPGIFCGPCVGDGLQGIVRCMTPSRTAGVAASTLKPAPASMPIFQNLQQSRRCSAVGGRKTEDRASGVRCGPDYELATVPAIAIPDLSGALPEG